MTCYGNERSTLWLFRVQVFHARREETCFAFKVDTSETLVSFDGIFIELYTRKKKPKHARRTGIFRDISKSNTANVRPCAKRPATGVTKKKTFVDSTDTCCARTSTALIVGTR